MGPINASIIGSLAREMMQSTAMRQPQPADERNRAVLMMDEAQNYLGESLSQTDAFAELRKFKLQLIIAQQYLDQLPKDIQHTVAQNVATQGTFRSSPEELLMAGSRPSAKTTCQSWGAMRWPYGSTHLAESLPPSLLRPPRHLPRTPHWSSIINNTRKTYARPRAEVEAEIAARHKKPEGKKEAYNRLIRGQCMKPTSRTTGRLWAYLGFGLGIGASIYGNVARVYVIDAHPAIGAIGSAAIWPLSLLIA
jgi:hypothetical protein